MNGMSTLTVEFGRDVDPDGRVPALYEAFMHVMSHTTIPTNWQIGLSILWMQSQLRPAKSNDFAALAALTEIDWEWPAFDDVRATFRANDTWPTPWHHYKNAAKDLRRTMKVERVKILVTTLRTTAVSRERFSGDQCNLMRAFGWYAHVDSDVARHYVERASSRVTLDDWRTWPPFYPGDVSQLVPKMLTTKLPRSIFEGR